MISSALFVVKVETVAAYRKKKVRSSFFACLFMSESQNVIRLQLAG